MRLYTVIHGETKVKFSSKCKEVELSLSVLLEALFEEGGYTYVVYASWFMPAIAICGDVTIGLYTILAFLPLQN